MPCTLGRVVGSRGLDVVLRLVLVAGVIGSRLESAERPDFSGSYVLMVTKGSVQPKKGLDWTLNVAQHDSLIEITKMMDGEGDNYKARLDGSETPYLSPGGAKGICTARIKGKTLQLETLVTSRPRAGAPPAQIRTKQKWNLSADGRTLTIRNEVEGAALGFNGLPVTEPWTEVYSRK